MPRVTIAIPVYNKGKYLAETIASAVAQTYDDFEILVLDNCSTDESWAIVESFDDARIRKVRWPENIGRIANFNRVFELADSEFVKLLDADDLMKPGCIAAEVEAFDAVGGDAAMTAVQHDLISAKGRTLLRSKGLHGLSGYYSGSEAVELAVRAAGNIFGTESTSLVRGEVARKVPWREGDLEIDFYLRVLTLGGLVVIPQSYIKVRLNSDSHSAKNAASYAKGYQRSVDELVGSGAFPDLQPLTPRERFRTSFYVTTFRMIQWVGVRV